MIKKVWTAFALLAILALVLTACSIHDTSGPSGPVAHMGNANFVQTSVTISKGESITLIDDVAVEHIIKNGTWKGSTPDTTKENGAPTYDATFNGNDSGALGPFTTSGTFQFYCTVHPGMNLTVIVK